MDSLPSQPNNSLIAGFRCLEEIVRAEKAIGSRELARKLDWSHARVNRLIGTLAYLGLLERDENRRYRPGQALHALAAQSISNSRLIAAALPIVKELGLQGQTVGLGTLWHYSVCYFINERPGRTIEEAILRHKLWPADNSALGVALLADAWDQQLSLPDQALDPQQDGLLPGQPLSVTVPEARERGYAVLRFNKDIVSVGVTIGSPAIAGLAVSGPHLGAEYVPSLATRLQDAAQQILDRLNQVPDDNIHDV